MAITRKTGNIFNTNNQTIVNTINCVGVMGAGIALECRLRYPSMYEKYINLCDQKKFDIGLLWVFRTNDPDRWILNFPTKKHWRHPSKKEYLYSGLRKFIETYKTLGISSIAFPMLGADKGGLSQKVSFDIMNSMLGDLDMDIEIYEYDPYAKDDLFDITKNWLLSNSIEYISETTNLRRNYIEKVIETLNDADIVQLNQLANVKGVGIKTLEKIFRIANNSSESDISLQQHLF
tara:strand:+ start:170 stop:871 length:702 start_codon:yes stop_codon:yes gene_type:complete